MTVATLTLSSKISPFPYAVIATAEYIGQVDVVFDESAGLSLDLEGTRITNQLQIIQALAQTGGFSGDSKKIDAFLILSETLRAVSAFPDIVTQLDALDDHLALRTFLVGHDITAADWATWGSIKGSVKFIGLLKNGQHKHLLRWFNHIESLDSTQRALANLTSAKADKARSNKTAASFALGLQNAKEGEVVTRFPPEPSGYLHIGHAKAAILNQYFAKMYKGKMIIRFDDTNPTKERAEFEETILEDLALLNIHGDLVTHTSDHFDKLYECAIRLIKAGKAYTDDTVHVEMKQQRRDGIPSRHRNDSVEDNLKHFAEMKAGTGEGLRWCLRAKISVDDNNKALRDPVIYRGNLTPHHRTGNKWKMYPTYDLACPIVDSLEGVTHALRTNEYRDRNPQYQWMIDALGLRPVNIWDFSRLNFIYTLLSKRKLHWFVDQGRVRGWDDPRFPTVRGIRRRGLTIEALTQFMLQQGPSQAIVSLEWDSLWALNKKIIDPIAPRFWAIVKKQQVVVTLQGGPPSPEVKSVPMHKKNPELGNKPFVFSSTILLEQEDASSFDDQEEITLMNWGNAIVRSKTVDSSGIVVALTMDLNLAGDFRKTKRKITWLAQPNPTHSLVHVTLLDHDYLITKKKPEKEDNVADFVTPISEFRDEAFTEASVTALNKGDIIQFERKGYYIYDGRVGEGTEESLEFIKIPDGKADSLAIKATLSSSAPKAEDVPVSTRMYPVQSIHGDDAIPDANTKMYYVQSIHADA